MLVIDRHYYLLMNKQELRFHHKLQNLLEVLDYKGNGSTNREERELVEIEGK